MGFTISLLVVTVVISCIVSETVLYWLKIVIFFIHNYPLEINDCEYVRVLFFTISQMAIAIMWCKNVAEKFNPHSRMQQRHKR